MGWRWPSSWRRRGAPAMTPAELDGRLDRRFEGRTGGLRGAVERHQTLRAAIDWSFELLTEPEQQLLSRLAVFAGGCTLQAVETICSGCDRRRGTVPSCGRRQRAPGYPRLAGRGDPLRRPLEHREYYWRV